MRSLWILMLAAACAWAADDDAARAPLQLSLKRAVELATSPEGNTNIQLSGEALKQAQQRSAEAASELASALMAGGCVEVEGVGVQLGREDVEIEFVAKEGFAAAGDRVGVVVLDTRIDAALLAGPRQRAGEPSASGTQRDGPGICRPHPRLDRRERPRAGGRQRGKELLEAEVLAIDVSTEKPILGGYDRRVDVDDEIVRICVARATR